VIDEKAGFENLSDSEKQNLAQFMREFAGMESAAKPNPTCE
jgi:hypothetical protein